MKSSSARFEIKNQSSLQVNPSSRYCLTAKHILARNYSCHRGKPIHQTWSVAP